MTTCTRCKGTGKLEDCTTCGCPVDEHSSYPFGCEHHDWCWGVNRPAILLRLEAWTGVRT
jgi:hypothetical protein